MGKQIGGGILIGKEKISQIEELAGFARVKILEMTSIAGAAHVGSSLSVVDIVSSLYSVIPFDEVAGPQGLKPNHLIFSKGHAAAALYAVLGLKGFFPGEWLNRYCADGSELGGHVTHGVPGVELSTGSLGHGLPFGVGVALSKQRSGIEGKTVVIVSDGELDEGSTWEALMVAAHHQLSNLQVFVDRNRLQSFTDTENTVALEPLGAKFRAFGWEVSEIDGHCCLEISEFATTDENIGKPRAAICSTVKGKGVSFMEDQVMWHYRPPQPAELTLALQELSER